MSTLAEIEAALPKLSPDELERLESFVQRLRRLVGGGSAPVDIAALERQNGFDALPERRGEPVTVEAVRQLLLEEGI